jgi:type I restriction enzyme S subunit
MKLKFDVSAPEFTTIRDILAGILPPGCRVWVFGSRAKNTARFNSDLDLALEASKAAPLPKNTLAKLKDIFTDAPLPYRVDVLDISEVSDAFQAIIRQQAVAFPLVVEKKVPKLRFPGFQDTWESTTLGSVAKRPSYGMNAAATEFDGTHKYIRITDISENERAFTPNPLTSPEPPISQEYKLKSGDIVFTRTSASTGKSYLYKKKDGDLYFAGFLIRFSITTAEPEFVFAQTLRSDFSKWITVVSMRSGQPGIKAQEYSNYSFHLPTLPEQRKIAAFLGEVDEKIAHLSRKKALLEDYKKGCMQQLFSQKIRFKDDDGNDFPDWEEKRLGEVADCLDNKRKPLNSTEREKMKGNVPYYGANGQVDSISDFIFDEPLVLLAEDGGNFDEFATRPIAQKIEGKSWVNNHAHILRVKPQKLVHEFLFQILVHRDIRRYINGSSRAKLNKSDMLSIIIEYPHPDEQRKIADFLSALDRKINLVAQELTHARSFKAGLLQQMFV